MNVRRFNPDIERSGPLNTHIRAVVDECNCGDFVRYKDYADLARKKEALVDVLKSLLWDLENCDWDCANCGSDYGMKDTDIYSAVKRVLKEESNDAA